MRLGGVNRIRFRAFSMLLVELLIFGHRELTCTSVMLALICCGCQPREPQIDRADRPPAQTDEASAAIDPPTSHAAPSLRDLDLPEDLDRRRGVDDGFRLPSAGISCDTH